MFAGKTTALLSLYQAAPPKSRQLFKPKLDTRASGVRSHDGFHAEALAVSDSAEILKVATARYLFVDEAQFFDMGLTEVCRTLALRGHMLRLAGLDLTFTGEPFGPMPNLMVEADLVQKLHTRCARCGSPWGSKTFRLDGQRPTDMDSLVGGADKYEARCRHCLK